MRPTLPVAFSVAIRYCYYSVLGGWVREAVGDRYYTQIPFRVNVCKEGGGTYASQRPDLTALKRRVDTLEKAQ